MSVQNAVQNAGTSIWKLRVAILYCVLFSVNSLLTTLIASLVNADWSAMNMQSKLLLYFVVGANWTGTMLAFMSKNSKKLEDGDLPDDTTTTVVVPPKPGSSTTATGQGN